MKGTAVLLLIAAVLAAVVLGVLSMDTDLTAPPQPLATAMGAAGIALALFLAADSWRRAGRGPAAQTLASLFLGFCFLLTAPAWSAYRHIDRWQDLARLGSQIKAETSGHPLILLAPDETTRAFVDLYVGEGILSVPESDAAVRLEKLAALAAGNTAARVLVEIDGREFSPTMSRITGAFKHRPNAGASAWELPWLAAAHLRLSKRFSLPNGRRYALLEPAV
jgi:hypothetical protein